MTYPFSASILLRSRMTIDLEGDGSHREGFPNFRGFDVDSLGNIFCHSDRVFKDIIYMFDSKGRFKKSFCRKGNSISEVGGPYMLRVGENDEVQVSNISRNVIIIYSNNGRYLREVRMAPHSFYATVLGNGRIVSLNASHRSGRGVRLAVQICGHDLTQSKQLCVSQKLVNYVKSKKVLGLGLGIKLAPWSMSRDLIYVGSTNEKQISVFNHNGALLRIMTIESDKQEVTNDMRESVAKKFKHHVYEMYDIDKKIYFPKVLPSFQYYFSDLDGTLYVMTFRKASQEREYIYNVYDHEGRFLSNLTIDNSGNDRTAPWGGPYDAHAKDGLLYYMRRNSRSRLEIVVKAIDWKSS